MTLTLSLLLIPYGLAVLAFAVVSVFNVYHLLHYGATSKASFLFTLAFVAGTAVIGLVTFVALRNVDWQEPISIEVSSGDSDATEFMLY